MTRNPHPIREQVARLRAHFNAGHTQKTENRIQSLKKLKQAITDHEEAITRALEKDLGKAPEEAYMTEISESLREIDLAIRKLPAWARTRRVPTPLIQQPATSHIRPEPLGVVLIISPWNYPFLLLMAPLTAALAAGNCAILKPSEMTPHTSRLIAELIQKTFDPALVNVVEGGADKTTLLLEEKFDHIFFTGGPQVGKIVMKAAAEHLTPVTLELGGKSPCIVDQDIHLKHAARRITWGKFLNAGQTCVAPDYLLVHHKIKNALLHEIKESITHFFGTDPGRSGSYGRIVNTRHFHRVAALISREKVLLGGVTDEKTRYIAPTLLDNVSPEDPVMAEEIFGPLLPVLTYDHIDEAIDFVNQRPKPLALYIFSQNRDIQETLLSKTSSGGACVNDTIVHIASPDLPFGGVGESGMGNYHGKAGFDTFSHRKSIMKRSTLIDLPLRYPPFKPLLKQVLKRI